VDSLFKFSAQEIDLTYFVGNRIKVKISSEIKPPLIKSYFCNPSPTDKKTLPKVYSIPFEDTTHSLIFIVDYFVVTCKLVKSRFCEKDAKILQNNHHRFVLCSKGQVYGGDFAKFCGLLRTYELYLLTSLMTFPPTGNTTGTFCML
jgi:hypothetical protein